MKSIPEPPARHPLSRRSLLTGGAAAAAFGLSSCGIMSLEPSLTNPPVPAKPGQKEAPALAARVAEGALPPVEQRLPVKPEIVTPTDRLGDYGGTWRSGMLGTVSVFQAYTYAAWDGLLRWNPEFTAPEPNIAEAVEVKDDGRTFLFTLREGLRWSDGAPLTSDDVVFAFDDVIAHPDLLAGPSPEYVTRGNPGRIEKIDDLQFAFHFDDVNGLFLANMAGPGGYALTQYPKHYLEPFHKDYDPDVESEANSKGFASWADHFFSKVGRGYWDLPRWQTTELPTVACWVVREPLGQGSRLVLERNPYYYKVDTEGRQLPYLDEVVLDVIGDAELMSVQVTNGELTFPQVDVLSLTSKPVYAANRSKRKFHFVDAITTEQNQLSLQLNLNTENEVLRQVFQDRDVRIGLSHAVDRQEIIDAVYQRQGEPWQLAPRRESPFWDEEMAKQYTEFDLERANDLLDGAGLEKRDENGVRLMPDGNPLTFDMAVTTQTPAAISALDLVSQHWRRAGVRMRVNSMDRSLFYQRKGQNQLDAAAGPAAGALLDAMYDPRLWMPNGGECLWAPTWSQWFLTNGAEGEEPPAIIREQMEIYRSISDTVDMDDQVARFREVMQVAKEEFFAIGVCLPIGNYSIIQDKFQNFPQEYISSWIYPTPGPMHPEQFFIDAQAVSS